MVPSSPTLAYLLYFHIEISNLLVKEFLISLERCPSCPVMHMILNCYSVRCKIPRCSCLICQHSCGFMHSPHAVKQVKESCSCNHMISNMFQGFLRCSSNLFQNLGVSYVDLAHQPIIIYRQRITSHVNWPCIHIRNHGMHRGVQHLMPCAECPRRRNPSVTDNCPPAPLGAIKAVFCKVSWMHILDIKSIHKFSRKQCHAACCEHWDVMRDSIGIHLIVYLSEPYAAGFFPYSYDIIYRTARSY